MNFQKPWLIHFGRQLSTNNQRMKPEGSKVQFTFEQTGSGLMLEGKYDHVKGFAYKKFHWGQRPNLR